MKKLIQEEVIEQFRQRHGNRYDYSHVVYNGMHKPVTVICPVHGPFSVKPSNHITGSGCPECVRKKWTTETFVLEARKVHGNKYDYSKVKYTGTRNKVCIISHEKDKDGNEIGEFWQYPMSHLSGQVSHKEHHGFKKEDAWETRTCPICGENFEVRKKYRKICCSEECRRTYIELHKEEINRKKSVSIKETFSNKTAEDWKRATEKQKKTCLAKYGKENYSQTDEGRKKCSRNMKLMKHEHDRKYKDEVLIPKYKEICEKDGLELINFRSRFDCDVRCKKCGNEFNVKVLGYLTPDTNTNLCRVCYPIEPITGPTDFEDSFERFIKTTGLKYIKNCRTVIYPKEIDFYFPDLKIGFELDGLYWHCEEQKPDDYHLEKTEKCIQKGVRLIHIFEDEWRDKRDICKSRVMDILGIGINKIGARKCEIREVDNIPEKKFLNDNHIQGYVASKYCYGLFYNDEIVSLMSFSALRKNLGHKSTDGKYELLRFCNKIGVTVQGGASRLFRHFIKEVNPSEIISYADRRWSFGNMYEKIGMKFQHNTKPNYFYLLQGLRKNRFSFRKDVLVKKYGCPKEMSEHEFCLSQHWYRIYDCGSKLYKMENIF